MWVMISVIAFDRPHHLSHLRGFLYDRFRIYTIVLIVWIKLSSIQAVKVISVIRVVCDCLGCDSIRLSLPSEHYLG